MGKAGNVIYPIATPACLSFKHSVSTWEVCVNPNAALQCRRFVSKKSAFVIIRVDS